jgi:hypothetical protein
MELIPVDGFERLVVFVTGGHRVLFLLTWLPHYKPFPSARRDAP